MADTATKKQILIDRYALSDEVRSGGMSTVTKAFDIDDHLECAIKRMKDRPDTIRTKESFHRERTALVGLGEHPNIVKLLAVDVDAEGAFLVLEWVSSNLEELVESGGPIDWDKYYDSIGRPILEAIVFAQSRDWNHRDIKPANILITDSGVPKIADYGIAKHFLSPGVGLTFAGFRSQPYTPPEDDIGGESAWTRDVYSWAATSIFALTGTQLDDYGELSEALGQLDRESCPIEALEGAISHTPSERPPLASVLLTEIDSWADKRRLRSQPQRECHVSVEVDCVSRVSTILGAGERVEVEKFFANELNELFGMRRLESNGEVGWRVFAIEWTFEMYRTVGQGDMRISKAFPSSAGEVERRREAAFKPQLTFKFSRPRSIQAAEEELECIFVELDDFESSKILSAQEAQEQRIFRLWYGFLRAKADLEARRETSIPYKGYSIQDSLVAFETLHPAPLEIVGQSRVIKQSSSDPLFCEIVDVSPSQIYASVTYGNTDAIPIRGDLEFNTIAAERSIDRQRAAVDAVNYNRAVSTELRPLIVDPTRSKPPSPVIGLDVDPKELDKEKQSALSVALGTHDLIAIHGPPGTGKTRLIAEIIVRYMDENPKHRILLSSQTHVALDNVLSRVRVRQPELELVRIGKLDEPKIATSSRDLILDRKADAWSQKVIERASEFLSDWSEERGIERNSIEIGLSAERLIRQLAQIEDVRTRLSQAQSASEKIENEIDDKVNSTGSTGSNELNTESRMAQEEVTAAQNVLYSLKKETKQTREKLEELGGYGSELANADTEELREWSSFLLGSSPAEIQCRKLLELHEDWILRVGKSSDFHAAMLASSQVVAGTCIGVAGVRGMTTVSYDLCIVDEASKATATEILVPMSRSKKWVLVGDPEQLPPFFEDEALSSIDEFSDDEIRETLLERFLNGLPDHCVVRLTNQYRMVRPIGELVSQCFYEGNLNSPKTKADVQLTGAFPKPVTWLSTSKNKNRKERQAGPSVENDVEAQLIKEILEQLNFIAQNRRKTYDVALIAGYRAQAKSIDDVIRDQIHEWRGLSIACNTVDAFQGNEAEICIYSVTRSNPEGRIGFLREKPRLNVALSRGRSALIIVGDDEFCRTAEGQNPFKRVLEYIDMNPDTCELRFA